MPNSRTHRLLPEGMLAGAIGATVVAAWFLILDMAQGQAFYTPSVLGTVLFSVLGFSGLSQLLLVAGYTLFHYAAFGAVGVLLVFLVHRARKDPAVLAGLLLVFAVFELGFYGLVALLATPELLGNIAWYQIAIGNLLAAAAMGGFLVRTHPMLGRDFSHALSGRE